MTKISTYPVVSPPLGTDLLIGTDVASANATKNFLISDIIGLVPTYALTIKDEGVLLTGDCTSIDFVGASIVATAVGGAVTVTASGGTASGLNTEVQYNAAGLLDGDPAMTFISGTSTLNITNIVSTDITSSNLVTVNSLQDTIITLQGGLMQNTLNPDRGQLSFESSWSATNKGVLLLNGALVSSTPSEGSVYTAAVYGNSINGNTAGVGGAYLPTYGQGARIESDCLYASDYPIGTPYTEARLVVSNDPLLTNPLLQIDVAAIVTSNAVSGNATMVISPGDSGECVLKLGSDVQADNNVWSIGQPLFIAPNPVMADDLVFSDFATTVLGVAGSARMSLSSSQGKTVSSVLKLYNSQSDFFIGLQADNGLAISRTYVLPTAIPIAGNPNKVLECDHASTMEWAEKGSPVLSLVGVPIAYTLVMSDAYGYIRVDTTGAGTIDCPHDATTDFPIGTEISFINVGSGNVIINGAPGTNINFFSPSGNLSCFIPGGGAGGIGRAWTIKKIASNTYDIIGNLG